MSADGVIVRASAAIVSLHLFDDFARHSHTHVLKITLVPYLPVNPS